MLPRFLLMTALSGCGALHVAPTRSFVKPVARRAAVLVMDEEAELYSVPFTNVTAAATEIKEVLTKEGFSDADATTTEDAAKVAWMAKNYGEQPSSPAAEASLPPATQELSALYAEKNELDESLMWYGYDAEKVQRLAEVEALIAAATAVPEAPPAEEFVVMTQEVAALAAEKNELDEFLMWNGYNAEKVQRLAEVEALLAEAGGVPQETTALSAEEAAKAAWLAARQRPW